MQLHCALRHCVAAALCIVPWQFLQCKGLLWSCSSSRAVVLCSAALRVVPQPCSFYCSIALRAAALRIVRQHCASCHGVMLRGLALCVMLGVLLCAADIALCAAALATALRGRVTAPHVQPLHHLLSLRKWRNNQPAALVTVFVGGILTSRGSAGAALKNKKSTSAIWLWSFDQCQQQILKQSTCGVGGGRH